jgi:FKBP-type peptidyl-prolyl cis-trans isomerase
MADSNTRAGDAYREENAKRAGVQTTASGLQYEVVTQGTGPRPAASDRVRVHYRGTLIDGKEFDSSHRTGQPATFVIGEVIPGWIEALQLMPVGSKYRLVIPPALAYGPQGSPPDIGPNATLVFEVELLGIEQ